MSVALRVPESVVFNGLLQRPTYEFGGPGRARPGWAFLDDLLGAAACPPFLPLASSPLATGFDPRWIIGVSPIRSRAVWSCNTPPSKMNHLATLADFGSRGVNQMGWLQPSFSADHRPK